MTTKADTRTRRRIAHRAQPQRPEGTVGTFLDTTIDALPDVRGAHTFVCAPCPCAGVSHDARFLPLRLQPGADRRRQQGNTFRDRNSAGANRGLRRLTLEQRKREFGLRARRVRAHRANANRSDHALTHRRIWQFAGSALQVR